MNKGNHHHRSDDFSTNKIRWPSANENKSQSKEIKSNGMNGAANSTSNTKKREATLSSKYKMNNQLLAQTKSTNSNKLNSERRSLALERWNILKRVELKISKTQSNFFFCFLTLYVFN